MLGVSLPSAEARQARIRIRPMKQRNKPEKRIYSSISESPRESKAILKQMTINRSSKSVNSEKRKNLVRVLPVQ